MILRARDRAVIDAHNDRVRLAYHVALLSRCDPKRIGRIVRKIELKPDDLRRSRPRQQTPEQMLGIVKMLNAAFGGTVVDKTKH